MTGTRRDTLITSSEAVDKLLDCEDGSKSPSRDGRRKSLWKKVKCQLVEFHALPAYLRDNEFILDYYRAEWPLRQVLLSIFTIHNETLNVWTHLVGFFLFLFLTICTAIRIPEVVDLQSLCHLPDFLGGADLHKIPSELLNYLPSLPDSLHKFKDELTTSLPVMDSLSSVSSWSVVEYLSKCFPEQLSHIGQTGNLTLGGLKNEVANMLAPLVNRPITRWPFFAFLGGAMFCLLASSTCHLLSCHSKRLSYIMLRLDYAGIAALISTSFYPPVYYSFMCSPFFCSLYLSLITLLGVATIVFSLFPVFDKPKFRSVRASLFFGMGVSGVAPILHKLILYRHREEALQTTGYEILMGILYGLGALIYATRIPERWRPGKFDIAGHSHQLFHVLVVAGAFTHYKAGLVYLRWRDLEGC